jgi:hypothetical protein
VFDGGNATPDDPTRATLNPRDTDIADAPAARRISLAKF